MDQAGKRLNVHVYPECGHGFMDPSSPTDVAPVVGDAIKDAQKRIYEFLARELTNG
jgi:hypothetical protein